jgi:Cdc6-like AAA superfamily ATPase
VTAPSCETAQVDEITRVFAVLSGIANRINLPELLLPKLAGGPAKFSRLLFEPYSESQITAIINSRVDAAVKACSPRSLALVECEAAPVQQVFHALAAKLIARKVSQKSAGDARKALELASAATG